MLVALTFNGDINPTVAHINCSINLLLLNDDFLKLVSMASIGFIRSFLTYLTVIRDSVEEQIAL